MVEPFGIQQRQWGDAAMTSPRLPDCLSALLVTQFSATRKAQLPHLKAMGYDAIEPWVASL